MTFFILKNNIKGVDRKPTHVVTVRFKTYKLFIKFIIKKQEKKWSQNKDKYFTGSVSLKTRKCKILAIP